MATQKDVRRIALSLPQVVEKDDRFAFAVVGAKGKPKEFAWVWLERVHPKKARVPCPEVLAFRVADETEKAMLLGSDEEKFFTEPHYKGFPAVLLRLPTVDSAQLKELLVGAWRCQAPKALLAPSPERTAKKPAKKAAAKRRR